MLQSLVKTSCAVISRCTTMCRNCGCQHKYFIQPRFHPIAETLLDAQLGLLYLSRGRRPSKFRSTIIPPSVLKDEYPCIGGEIAQPHPSLEMHAEYTSSEQVLIHTSIVVSVDQRAHDRLLIDNMIIHLTLQFKHRARSIYGEGFGPSSRARFLHIALIESG
jgi:hypothetical protein